MFLTLPLPRSSPPSSNIMTHRVIRHSHYVAGPLTNHFIYSHNAEPDTCPWCICAVFKAGVMSCGAGRPNGGPLVTRAVISDRRGPRASTCLWSSIRLGQLTSGKLTGCAGAVRAVVRTLTLRCASVEQPQFIIMTHEEREEQIGLHWLLTARICLECMWTYWAYHGYWCTCCFSHTFTSVCVPRQLDGLSQQVGNNTE